MKALITGQNGFTGRWLARHLEICGDTVLPLPEDFDVTQPQSVRSALIEAEPDVVFHLAARTSVGESWKNPLTTFEINANGTLNVLDAALACEVTPTVLLASSADVYGHVGVDDLPVRETHPLVPLTPFAASKVAAEYLGVQACAGTRLPVVRARTFNVTGPGQSSSFVVPALADRIVAAEQSGGREISVGNLHARRDYTDIRDVVRAYRALTQHGVPGEVYNVCSGIDISVEDIARRMLKVSGLKAELAVDPSLMKPGDLSVLKGDNAKIAAATGWRPEIGLDQTVADVLSHERDRNRS